MSVKELIDSSKPMEGQEFPAALLRLISLGKIMEDDKTLKEYNVKEGSFLVCMVQKEVKQKVEAPKPVQVSPSAPVNPPSAQVNPVPVPAQAPAPAQPAALNAQQEAAV
jgi:hypothetical protein